MNIKMKQNACTDTNSKCFSKEEKRQKEQQDKKKEQTLSTLIYQTGSTDWVKAN